jgi:hypothetical protein
LGKVLGELTRRLGKQLVKPDSGEGSAEIAPRRVAGSSPVAPVNPCKSHVLLPL